MPDAARGSRVTVAARPLWQIRALRAAPRALLYALCLAGLLSSARFALDPPGSAAPAIPAPSLAGPDLASEGYAALFARRYLTWNASEPEASQRALSPFLGAGLDPDAGLRLPASGEQHVAWVEVVQGREPARGEHVYTIAAQTDTAGLLYLTVGVVRRVDGTLALAGYPAFVGPPASGPAQAPARAREVSDPALAAVVERALRNYLGASEEELAADLASGARVSLPAAPLTMTSIGRLSWSTDGRSVLASVQAEDRRGVSYALSYELDVSPIEGRWEVTAVQMDPDA